MVFTMRLATRKEEAETGPSRSARPGRRLMGDLATLPAAIIATGLALLMVARRSDYHIGFAGW
jgi:hypothetical protein